MNILQAKKCLYETLYILYNLIANIKLFFEILIFFDDYINYY